MARSRWTTTLVAAFGAAVGLTAPAAQADPVYAFTTLDNGTNTTFPQGINNTGVVSGYYLDSGGAATAFLYNGGFTDNNFPGSSQTFGAGINAAGNVVGAYVDSGGVYHAYYDNAGTFSTIDDPNGSSFNSAHGINDVGKIVGYYTQSSSGPATGFLYNIAGTSFSNIADPNAGAQDNAGTVAMGINNSGLVVGFYTDASGNVHGFTFDGTTYATLDDVLGTEGTYLYGVNNLGDIVGEYVDSGGDVHGLLYDGRNFFTVDDPLALGVTEIFGINDTQQITGDYVDDLHGLIADPVPEPASLALFGAALAGFGVLRRRRKAPA